MAGKRNARRQAQVRRRITRERAARARAEARLQPQGAALHDSLQGVVEAPLTPRQVINGAFAKLEEENAALRGQLSAAQDELLRIVNVGLTGQALRQLVTELVEAVQWLEGIGISLPSRNARR